MLFLLSKDLLNWQADAQNPHGRPVQYQGSDVSEECIQGGGGGGTWNVPQAGLRGGQGLVGDPARAASWLA